MFVVLMFFLGNKFYDWIYLIDEELYMGGCKVVYV